jgi:hypothetical protein
MTEPNPVETRVQSGEAVEARSKTLQDVLSTVESLGGPAAAAGVAKLAKDVVVAKIQATAQIEVAKIQSGRPSAGGAHRQD